jgi:hypothetical protein
MEAPCTGVVETGRCPVSDVRRGGCGDLPRRETPRRETPHRGVSTSRPTEARWLRQLVAVW